MQVLRGYPHIETLVKIVTQGVEAQWSCTAPALRPPKESWVVPSRFKISHKKHSGRPRLGPLWRYAIRWPHREKKGSTHPLKSVQSTILNYPEGESTNSSFKSDSVPTLNYEPITKIARRIEYLPNDGDPSRNRIVKGDVRGAYQYHRTIATQVFRMVAFVKESNIWLIDLAAPFGWAESPSFYELDVGDRLHQAEVTWHHAMLAILRSPSINISKFTEWSSELVALISIPTDKMAKALQRARAMLSRRSATKTKLQKAFEVAPSRGNLRPHIKTVF
ncbi:hypothetical protein PHMEG_00027735 [Phytophthora megakarya]|uniref:Uncharacterized protein n=1 Tax=Phytophthora megakarya TaxID=4795 RepID=A0A225V6J0_9STRA|nr:hypothetical protein PHMEG_00027735 [Phytophthora megakarya]